MTELLRKKIGALPHKPGIYLMRDRFGTVIYVGKARNLRKRVSQYFHPSRRMGWDLKFNALIEAVCDFDFHLVRSEPEALLLESKLIKEFKPRYNVSFRDDKRHLMLKVNLNDPIPNFTFARFKKDDGARYFGPFANAGALRNTMALVRRQFNLRGCRAFTPGEADYKHCLYAHLKYCTAPCVGNVTREQYMQQVQAACEFIEGQCREMQDQLETEMKKAAAAQDFEKAAGLRDMLRDLKATTRRTEKFERIPYTLPGHIQKPSNVAELAGALGLSSPPQRIEAFDISNISGTFAVASLVSFKNGRPDRANYRRFKIKTVAGQDDFASMAEVVRRRYTRLLADSAPAQKSKNDEAGEAVPQELQKLVDETSRRFRNEDRRSKMEDGQASATPSSILNPPSSPQLPDLILIDGGKGQLGMASEELKKLGLERIPVIGLAKEFEEIYMLDKSEPLRLGLDHPATKLLQRIRDESHRVANSYNAQLRLKRISESLLDEFPGIGERRKAALLKKFGSVQRLRTATLEQIAEVPGFGGKAAEELKKFLEARTAGANAECGMRNAE
ncbi:MAG TPA: excinuclease ABC subunit UvrC [Candidatus Sulfotelmatobacter sp.]|nr:excinuclease ABC subunit UvrC [Candidatus Sulfotelmatobacter sp.]